MSQICECCGKRVQHRTPEQEKKCNLLRIQRENNQSKPLTCLGLGCKAPATRHSWFKGKPTGVYFACGSYINYYGTLARSEECKKAQLLTKPGKE